MVNHNSPTMLVVAPRSVLTEPVPARDFLDSLVHVGKCEGVRVTVLSHEQFEKTTEAPCSVRYFVSLGSSPSHSLSACMACRRAAGQHVCRIDLADIPHLN